jgi:hypothetical protein
MFRNWSSDPEVTKHLSWPTHENIDVSREVIKNWLPRYEADNNYNWAIEMKALGEPIGSIAAVKVEDNTNLAQRNMTNSRNKCTLTFKWTICLLLLMKPSDLVQPKLLSNMVGSILSLCLTLKGICFVCAVGS